MLMQWVRYVFYGITNVVKTLVQYVSQRRNAWFIVNKCFQALFEQPINEILLFLYIIGYLEIELFLTK